MNDIIKKRLLIAVRIAVLVIIAVFITVNAVRCAQIDRTAVGTLEHVTIDGVEYVEASFAHSLEMTVFAKSEPDITYSCLAEDPERNFIVSRSFLDQRTLVRADYDLPPSDEISVVYIGDYTRYTDEAHISLANDVSKGVNTGYFDVCSDSAALFSGGATKALHVGYGECTVGTDYVNNVGFINGKLVYVTGMSPSQGVYRCFVLPDVHLGLSAEFRPITFELADAS